MNSQEWLQTLNDNWDNLLDLVMKFHPNSVRLNETKEYPITAKKAEEVCEEIRKEITRSYPIMQFRNARDNNDISSLLSILNETWFGMPESTAVRYEPGFHTLCDLCEGVDDDEELEM